MKIDKVQKNNILNTPNSLQMIIFLYVIKINFNELKLNEIVRDN